MIEVIISKYKKINLIEFSNRYKGHMHDISNYAWNILYEELKDYNIDLTKEEILYNQNGKPYINNDIYFNISHSGDMVAVGLSRSPIGIDIESTDRFKNEFNPEEWVQRESIIKLEGSQISLDKMRYLDYSKYVTNIKIFDNYFISVINKKGEKEVIWKIR